ncbi:hypothetical protein FZEAL_6769 [Fusarium zealandicum]|uniref:F-box domain-containing protein n=1 Tax=Fusarium zealandicum TaxID=1053134 RepID=A0A8H4XJA4_9HYPO|nr:hypothetical protein FZEAL_6769 [Fusarium zealandicum]
MGNSSTASLRILPTEILNEIISLIPRPTLLCLRLVNRQLGVLATVHAFRSVRLGAREGIANDYECFCSLAHKEDAALPELGLLRHLVREATLDTWVGPHYEYNCNNYYRGPEWFMNLLPNLRHFHNLSAVHLRFNEFCVHLPMLTWGPEETSDFRYRVLDTVFRCIAGTWNLTDQERVDRELELFYEPYYGMCQVVRERTSTGPLPIKSLTISNLGDYLDPRLTTSEAFKTVMSLPSLVDLKLYIATEVQDGPSEDAEGATWFFEKYDLFERLPQTWLQPSLATNLRTLSLYCGASWGWSPKMDFRLVNPSEGGFPNLRVLALGNYIFSHEWQIDWIATQGKDTVAGGLEELYLDACYVMFYAHHLVPLDESETIAGKDLSGNSIRVSNKGYQRNDLILEMNEGPGPMAQTAYSLRWHTILPRWRESMTALKVFRMGRGSGWSDAAQVVVDIQQQDNPCFFADSKGEHRPFRNFEENAFRSFDCPRGSTAIEKGATGFPGMERYRHGVGLNEERRHQLKYAFSDMDAGPVLSFDIDESDHYGWSDEWPQLEEGVREKDKAALELFVSMVQSRREVRGDQ